MDEQVPETVEQIVKPINHIEEKIQTKEKNKKTKQFVESEKMRL